MPYRLQVMSQNVCEEAKVFIFPNSSNEILDNIAFDPFAHDTKYVFPGV